MNQSSGKESPFSRGIGLGVMGYVAAMPLSVPFLFIGLMLNHIVNRTVYLSAFVLLGASLTLSVFWINPFSRKRISALLITGNAVINCAIAFYFFQGAWGTGDKTPALLVYLIMASPLILPVITGFIYSYISKAGDKTMANTQEYNT